MCSNFKPSIRAGKGPPTHCYMLLCSLGWNANFTKGVISKVILRLEYNLCHGDWELANALTRLYQFHTNTNTKYCWYANFSMICTNFSMLGTNSSMINTRFSIPKIVLVLV